MSDGVRITRSLWGSSPPLVHRGHQERYFVAMRGSDHQMRELSRTQSMMLLPFAVAAVVVLFFLVPVAYILSKFFNL